jgi:hypothetical protein
MERGCYIDTVLIASLKDAACEDSNPGHMRARQISYPHCIRPQTLIKLHKHVIFWSFTLHINLALWGAAGLNY